MITYKNYKLIEDKGGKKALFVNKNKKNKNLVVFVHGFTGNHLSTWGQLPDLLTRDPRLLQYDFLFWGYSSNFIVPRENFIQDSIQQLLTQILSKHKTNQNIEIVAQGLQTELKYLDEYDNITLVGHSMGGLIIRSYVIQNLKEKNKENNDRIDKINQIILFGTPNEGMDIANNTLLGGLDNQIHDMGSYNDFIDTLREDWVELVFKNKDIQFNTLMVAGEDDYFVPFEQVTKYFRNNRELTKGNHLTMVKPESIHDTAYKIIINNILQITHRNIFEMQDTSKHIEQKKGSSRTNELIQKILKLIADGGLDDNSWIQTLPSQYFMVKLARVLQLNHTSEYLTLLDTFLKNYHMKVENKIVLSEMNNLDTPEELEEMRQSMLEEDKKDDYFSRYSKHAADNLDIQLLHDNYQYGLMAQIAHSKDFPESMTLRLVEELAIQSLLYGNGKKPTNDLGGWYPQRLPWITGRILIGLKNSNYEIREDKKFIEETVAKAIEYLMRSTYQDTHWRSGIGDYVSDWEATAICLEALDKWGKIKDYEGKIYAIIDFILENEEKWLVSPSFDSKENSNRTLAAVTLLSTAIRIINKHFKKKYDLRYDKYFTFLSQVLDQLIHSPKFQAEQYSTIHQIVYYIAKMALEYERIPNEKTNYTTDKHFARQLTDK